MTKKCFRVFRRYRHQFDVRFIVFILSAALKPRAFINDIILMNVMMFVTKFCYETLGRKPYFKALLQRYTDILKAKNHCEDNHCSFTDFVALSIIQLVSHIFNVSLLLISTYIFLSYNQVDSEVFT